MPPASNPRPTGRPPAIDVSRPSPARIYDYWLGGKDHFAADRAVATHIAELAPWVISSARGNRAFLRRAVTHLTRAGIRQYLDIGSGLPTAGNVHQIAQRLAPHTRVAYVDNDPIVLAHAHALLATDPRTIAVTADARDPHTLLTHPAIRAHLDLTQPVAVLLIALLHFLPGEQPTTLTTALRDHLAPGSHLAITHVADLPDVPGHPQRAAATHAAAQAYNSHAAPFTLRTPEQITALFHGYHLLPPGIVPAHRWHPTRGRPGPAIPVLAGIARLPRPDRPDRHTAP